METETYLAREDYDAVISAIMRLPADLLVEVSHGMADADTVKLMLGEHGNVWPMSIRSNK